MTKIKKLGYRVVIQAVRDFAFPEQIERVAGRLSRISTSDPIRETILKEERKSIINELRGDFVVSLSSGESCKRADKLQSILDDKTGLLLQTLRQNVRSCDINKED